MGAKPMTELAAKYMKDMRARRKAAGLVSFRRDISPEWIPVIDAFIKKLQEKKTNG